MDISYILSNSCADRVPLTINPSLNQKVTVYNLLEILSLPKLPTTPITPPQQADFDMSSMTLSYNNRLLTFKSHWTLEHITPKEMTDAGFYYLGPGMRVRCLFCSVEIDQWESKNDPIFEHKLVSPSCDYFKENAGYDVCGPFKDVLQCPSLRGDTIAQKIKNFFDFVAFEQKGAFYGNRTMAHFEVRLKTYDKLLNKTMTQDIRTLCEAGFIYSGTGESDLMTCFCCYFGLRDWQPNDDPWTEHAVWAPHCTYLLLMKGKQFVEETCNRNYRDTNSFVKPEWQEWPNLINEERDVIPYGVTESNTEHTVEIDGQLSGVTDGPHENSGLSDDQRENPGLTDGPNDNSGITDDEREHPEVTDGQCEPSGITDDPLENSGITECPLEHSGLTDVQNENSAVDPVDQPENVELAVRQYDQCGVNDNLHILSNLRNEQITESNAMLCKICLKEKVETVSIPCGHAIACVQCSVTLDLCAVCRFPVNRIMGVFPYLAEESVKYPNQLECLSPKQDNEPVDPMLCKICHKDDMTIAFLPCRHVCACFACAATMEKCPVCVEPFFAILQVFL